MEKDLLKIYETAKKAADAAASADCASDQTLRLLNVSKSRPNTQENKSRIVLLTSERFGKQQSPTNSTMRMRTRKEFRAQNLLSKKANLTSQNLSRTSITQLVNQNQRRHRTTSANKASYPKPVKIDQTGGTQTSEKGQRPTSVNNGSKRKVENIDQTVGSPKSEKKQKPTSVNMGSKPKADNVENKVKTPAPIKLITSFIKTYDGLRDKIREQLFEALSKVSTEVSDQDFQEEINSECDPIRVATAVESVMFEKWGECKGAKTAANYRSVIFNIKDPKNPDFRRKILLGHVKPERIVNLTALEMASNQRKLVIQSMKQKALFDCEREGAPEATTDQFKCGRCGQRRTTYNQKQTRSADEPMTTYATCVNCNNRWKFC